MAPKAKHLVPYLFLKTINHTGSNNHSAKAQRHRYYRYAYNKRREAFAAAECYFAYYQ